MSRFILSILFAMIAAGLCDRSIGQNVNQPNDAPVSAPEPTTISNAFTRSLPSDATHASDIQTRIEASKPTARGYARAYYEPDATYSDPGLKPLLSPFPLNSDSSSSVDRFLQNIVLFIPPLASEAPPTTPLDSCSVSENSISNIPSSMDWRQNLNCSQVWINPQRMVLILAKESMICERVMDFCVCFILAKQVSAKMNVPAM